MTDTTTKAKKQTNMSNKASAEYKELVDAVFGQGVFAREDRAGSGADSYSTLMAKERRVLDTVDRVVNDAAATDAAARSFYEMPLHEIAIRVVGAIRGLMDDLIEVRKPEHVWRALMHQDRKVYLGIALIALAVVISMITASSPA